MDPDVPWTFNKVVGANVRRIRTSHGVTMDALARRCSFNGLNWATPRVGEFERGKIPATVPTMLTLAYSLHQLTQADISLPDLVEHDGVIGLTSGGVLDAEVFRRALSGEPIDYSVDTQLEMERAERDWAREAAAPDNDIPHGVSVMQLRILRRYVGLADERAAKRLGMSVDAFLAYCYLTHGFALSEVTSQKLPLDASPQARGRFTRQVIADIEAYREAHRGGQDG